MSSHDEPERDERVPSIAQVNPASLGDALADLPVPEHGPTFWADLNHRLQGEAVQRSATDAGRADPDLTPTPTPTHLPSETVSLEEERARRAARRNGRMHRYLGAAAAAVVLVVAVAGGLKVIQDDDGTDIRAADPPTGTTGSGTTPPGAPAEFSATYDGIEGLDGPDGCCSQWHLTVARDGSYRWTSTDGASDIVYNAELGMHWEVVTRGAGASEDRPNYIVSTGVPAGGPDQRVSRPDPLGPTADFVAALARVDDPRISTGTVAGRPTWHYDGPAVQDRLGGDGAPNHIVADVDQASGVLLELTRRIDDLVVNRFTASDIVTGNQADRTKYRVEVPPGAKTTPVSIGFEHKTLDEAAAAGLPYQLLVPNQVPDGFTLESVSFDRDVPSATGPEGMNPPAKQIVAMTWYDGTHRFTVTLRPKGTDRWDDPFGAEGMVPDDRPVVLPLPGRAPLNASVIVDAPFVPHLWGITGDIVVTVSGDLPRAELERVAGSLQPHRS
jgi:hypothetical protein